LAAEGLAAHAQPFLDQASAVDPLGEYAQRLFGADSPLPMADPAIEMPAYLLGAKGPDAPAEELDLELPEWLLETEAESESPEPAEADSETPTEEPAGEAGPAEVVPEAPGAATAVEPALEEQHDEWLESLPPSARPAPKLDDEELAAALKAAQAAYQGENLEAALSAYAPLVEAEQGLEQVIEALAAIANETDSLDAIELLGDACTRAGRHRDALAAYQRVLQRLDS